MRLIVLALIVIIGINCTQVEPKDVIWWNPEFGFLKKDKNNFIHYPMNCITSSIWKSIQPEKNREFILDNVELKGCEMREGVNKTTVIIKENSEDIVILSKGPCFVKIFGDSTFVLRSFDENKNRLIYDSILIRAKVNGSESKLNIEEKYLSEICLDIKKTNLLELTDQLELVFHHRKYFYSQNIQPEIKMKIELYQGGKLSKSVFINKFPCHVNELQKCLFKNLFNAKGLEDIILPIE